MIIGIVGIGLIGSSLARAFRAHAVGDVAIYDSSPLHMDQAKDMGLATLYCDSVMELAEHADIVFVCVPVDCIAEVVKDLCCYLKKGSIVTDVGSVKSALTQEIRSFLPEGISLVAGHPIAGTEHSGPESGTVDLFANKTYVLINNPGDEAATAKIAEIIQKTGAKIARMDADRHDVMLAFTSHLPHICAFSAMNCVEKVSTSVQENVMNFAGSSFRDLTRVAASDPEMWKSIFLGNRKHILEACKLFRQEIDHLTHLIEISDADGIKSTLDHASQLRRKHSS